jgi:hypothetical protein
MWDPSDPPDMSDDATLIRPGLPSVACRICDDALPRDEQWVVQRYADERTATPDGAVDGLCPGCHPTVAELVDDWTPVPEPPVDGESIAAGYGEVAAECSFCGDPLADPPVGVEYYRAGTGHDGPADHRHYALCGHCVTVFGEFLDTLSE